MSGGRGSSPESVAGGGRTLVLSGSQAIIEGRLLTGSGNDVHILETFPFKVFEMEQRFGIHETSGESSAFWENRSSRGSSLGEL